MVTKYSRMQHSRVSWHTRWICIITGISAIKIFWDKMKNCLCESRYPYTCFCMRQKIFCHEWEPKQKNTKKLKVQKTLKKKIRQRLSLTFDPFIPKFWEVRQIANPFHPPAWAIFGPQINYLIFNLCIFYAFKCCFDCSLCRTRCEFYISIMLRYWKLKLIQNEKKTCFSVRMEWVNRLINICTEGYRVWSTESLRHTFCTLTTELGIWDFVVL